jgi:hypothetical protein
MNENGKEFIISVKEYKELLAAKVRIEVFAEHVNNSKFSIEREECARYLNFTLKKEVEII